MMRRALALLAVVSLRALVGCGTGPIGGPLPTATQTGRATTTPTPAASHTVTVGITPPTAGATPTDVAVTPMITVSPIGTSTASPTPATSPTAASSPTATSSPTPESGSVLPQIVRTGQVVFRSQTGETCCVAVDPALLPANPQPGQPSLVLIDLPIGPATVTVAGYVQDFAPAPADVTATCQTLNTSGVASCDLVRVASAAYESAPKPVNILSGVRVNLGDVEVVPLPFLLDYAPPQGGQAQSPVAIRFTVVDAETGIAAPSIAADVTFAAAQPPLTQRVPLQLEACADGGASPCSPQASLDVTGYRATGTLTYPASLPAGAVTMRITAQNLAAPPAALDFSYQFFAAPQPTATATATFTPTPTWTPTPSATPSATRTATLVPTPTTSATSTRTATATPTRTAEPTATSTGTRTVTPSRTFTQMPTPTPTTLCDAAPRSGCRAAPASSLRLTAPPTGNSFNWRWSRGIAPLDEFGDPTTTTVYAICIYDSVKRAPLLAFAAQVEPEGLCNDPPCWHAVGSPPTGYRFIDPDGFQDGIERLLLRDRSGGRDSITAEGGGMNLHLPAPIGADRFFAQDTNVIVQLVNSVDGCWQSVFRPADVITNTADTYNAAR